MNVVQRCFVGLVAIAVVGPFAASTVETHASQTETAVAGTVVDREGGGKPLRRAIVTVSGGALPLSRSAITDNEGRFVIGSLPAGTFSIRATKGAWVSGEYGAARPGRAGTPVTLAAGQRLNVTIALSRAAALTGTIRDERGDPMPRMLVHAINATKPDRPQARLFGPTAFTDDRGMYRLYGLTPREYLIVASTSGLAVGDAGRPSTQDVDALLARVTQVAGTPPGPAASKPAAPPLTYVFAPVYFPGSSTLSGARRVKVGVGEVREGLDFTVKAVPVTTIEGLVVADAGLPSSLQMAITALDQLDYFGAGLQRTQSLDGEGRFRYSSVAPGRYRISARGTGAAAVRGRGAPPPVSSGNVSNEIVYGIEEIEVRDGQPVAGLTVRLQRGPKFSGRIVFEPGSPVPDPGAIQVALASDDGSVVVGSNGRMTGSFGFVEPARLQPDGTFEIDGLPPGEYSVRVSVAHSARNWWLRSAVLDGRDVLDTGLTMALGLDIRGAVLTMTERRSSLHGTLSSSGGAPAPDHFVVVMSANADWRRSGSRRLRVTRPSTDGRFSFDDLPAGDYLLVAVTDIDPDEWQKPEFLSSIASAGLKVTIGDGEKKRQDLQIKRPES